MAAADTHINDGTLGGAYKYVRSRRPPLTGRPGESDATVALYPMNALDYRWTMWGAPRAGYGL